MPGGGKLVIETSNGALDERVAHLHELEPGRYVAVCVSDSGIGEMVLVVDDEPSVRMLVTDVLEELGYTAIEAADGAAGLKVLQSDARIDLLVSDVGFAWWHERAADGRYRTRKPAGLKVLVITGYAENAAVGNGQLAPGMHVMTKLFGMESLAPRIRTLIEGG